MLATLLAPGQPAQQLTPAQLADLAPRLFDFRERTATGSEAKQKLTAYTWAAAQILGVKIEEVDVFSSTAEHLIFAVFDHTTGRNKEAEQQCARLISDDFFGDREPDGSSDEGHLFGPFLIIEAN